MKALLAVVALVALGYLGLCVALYIFQRSLIYYPQPRTNAAAPLLRLPVEGGEVLVSMRPHAGPHALLYFGGNGEDASYTLPELAESFPRHAIYSLHYRGYGGSFGTPSEKHIHEDAAKLFDRIRSEHADIVVMGRSLGSGVAVRLAAERPASRLILVTPFDSIEELAAAQFRYFPVRWLLVDKFESWRHAGRIGVPVLLIMAEHDEVVPRWSTEQLYRRFAPGLARLEVIPASGHVDLSETRRYAELLREAGAAPRP